MSHYNSLYPLLIILSVNSVALAEDNESWLSTRKPAMRLRGHTEKVCSVAFIHQGKILASGSEDKTVRLWDVASGKLLRILRCSNEVKDLVCAGDGITLFVSERGATAEIWDTEKGVRSSQLSLKVGYEWLRAVSAFRTRGVVAVGTGRQICLFDIDTAERTETISVRQPGFGDPWTTSLSSSPDEKLLAEGRSDETVRIWEIESRTVVATVGDSLPGFGGSSINSMRWSSDGRMLFVGYQSSKVIVWKADTKTIDATFKTTGTVNALGVSPDDTMLAVAISDRIELWNLCTGRRVVVFRSEISGEDWLFSIAFSHDGKSLATGGLDDQVKIWNVIDLLRD